MKIHNSRISNDIDMKLGRWCRNYKVIVFFPFLVNLEDSESQIPNLWSVEHTFSLTVVFYFTKTGNRTKKSLRQLS